jgi:hypothetical protein
MVSGGWADADANGGVGLPAGMDVGVGVAAGVKVGFGVEAGVGVVLGVIVGSGVEAGVGARVALGVIVGSGVVLGVVIVGSGDGVGVDTGLADRPQLNVSKLIRRRENARKRFCRFRPICEKSVRNAP